MPVRNCPWIKDKDFVIFTANYTSPITNKPMESRRVIDYLYYYIIKLRYRLGFFKWPNMEKRIALRVGRFLLKIRNAQKKDE